MTVTLSLWDQAPYIFIDGDVPGDALDEIDEELSYEVPDHQYTEAWKNNEWDGYHRLLRQSSNGNWYFPVGCLERVIGILELFQVDYEIEGLIRPGRGDLDLSWNTDMTLRQYQQEAVHESLQRGAGVIVMPTGAGKTLCGIWLVKELSHPTIVLVHRKEIADQWVERMGDILDVDVAQYYGGTRENGDVMVALYQSIYEDGEVRDDVRLDHPVALFDEVHRVGAETFSRVALSITATYRFGMSATPEREDNATLRVIGGTGPIIADLSVEMLIERGYLAEPEWQIQRAPPAGGNYRQWQDEYRGEIVENQDRNDLVGKTVAGLPRPTLITVEHINHGERLEALIPDAELIYGDKPDRDELIQGFRDGDVPILISTRGIVGEGFDVPEIAAFVVAGGLKSETSLIQQVGRALRPGTDAAVICDFIDRGRWIGDHSEERLRTYKNYYGDYGPQV